ncbi:endonuclease [Chryseobacterium sp.]|uniref:endonuclease n=1 Tax=Chryseobacterium sp. TaxID=1871047 RepID=UPI002897E635|nr:endonuclease [Chryseobacterium sp.]
MPEGPVILLMKENIQLFEGEKVSAAKGSSIPENIEIKGKTVNEIKTFGKLTFLIFDDFVIKIHLLMFGSYSLYERKDLSESLRLALKFKNGVVYFYTCSVKFVHPKILSEIDWEADIMSKKWSDEKAEQKLAKHPEMMVCDALMDQDLFSGVGNIIKNEALFQAGIHPETLLKNLSKNEISLLIDKAKEYSFEFYTFKKKDQLKQTFKVYHQEKCPICGKSITKKETGKTKRTSFFCESDQVLFK